MPTPGVALNCASLNVTKPPAAMIVLAGMRYFFGVAVLSVSHQLPTSTAAPVGLKSSIVSVSPLTELTSASLTTMPAMFTAGSSAPGEPPMAALARQLVESSMLGLDAGFFSTSEKPAPSGDTGHGPAVL